MLEIDVVLDENFNESTSKFVVGQSVKVRLEHSLVSVSKWESVWEVAFLGKNEKTPEQTVSYLEMMILNEHLPPEVFAKLIEKHIAEINAYISAKMTATVINKSEDKWNPEVVTSELIYYWMIALNVPVEFQHWHFNRLITLIRVIQLKNTKKKPMSPQERRNLNRSRLAQGNTKG